MQILIAIARTEGLVLLPKDLYDAIGCIFPFDRMHSRMVREKLNMVFSFDERQTQDSEFGTKLSEYLGLYTWSVRRRQEITGARRGTQHNNTASTWHAHHRYHFRWSDAPHPLETRCSTSKSMRRCQRRASVWGEMPEMSRNDSFAPWPSSNWEYRRYCVSHSGFGLFWERRRWCWTCTQKRQDHRQIVLRQICMQLSAARHDGDMVEGILWNLRWTKQVKMKEVLKEREVVWAEDFMISLVRACYLATVFMDPNRELHAIR